MIQDDTPEFVIAALGASAGGLEPLETFFKHMPADAGIAFVIIQHLAPDHPTALPELLGRHTGMPVEQAEDSTQVVPNRVYIIPPNATLTIEKGTLGVTTPAEARGSRTPIDGFFKSLAEDRGEQAVWAHIRCTHAGPEQGKKVGQSPSTFSDFTACLLAGKSLLHHGRNNTETTTSSAGQTQTHAAHAQLA